VLACSGRHTICFADNHGCNGAARGMNGMKIYLLMLLIGALFTAIHFTSIPETGSKSLPQ
jgi:hypothetical protein